MTTTAIMIMTLILEPVHILVGCAEIRHKQDASSMVSSYMDSEIGPESRHVTRSTKHRPGVKVAHLVVGISPEVSRHLDKKGKSARKYDDFPEAKMSMSTSSLKYIGSLRSQSNKNRTGGRVRRHTSDKDVASPLSIDTDGANESSNYEDNTNGEWTYSSADEQAVPDSGDSMPFNYGSSKASNESAELFEARERVLKALRDTSRRYTMVKVRDPVILMHTLSTLNKDITLSLIEGLKK